MRRRTRFFLAAAGAAIALSVAGGAALLQGGSNSAQALAQQMRAADDPTVSAIGPNTEYHVVERTYRRYGAAADEIQAVPGNGPEVQISDLRFGFDGNGKETYAIANITNEAGQQLQHTELGPAGFVNTNTATGTTTSLGGAPQTATAFKANSTAVRDAQANDVESGKFDIVQRDQGAIIIRQTVSIPAISDQSGNVLDQGYTIPFVRDLNPMSSYTLTTLNPSSFMPVKTQTFVVDKAGKTSLIQEMDIVSETTGPIPSSAGGNR